MTFESEGNPVQQPAQRAETLRVIGRLLDAEGIRRAELTFHGPMITVRAPGGSNEQLFQTYIVTDLIGLEMRTRSHRVRNDRDATDRLEGLLRTLGQELDSREFQVTYVQIARGIRVTGRVQGVLRERWFSIDELSEKNRLRHQLRRARRAATGWLGCLWRIASRTRP